MGEIKKSLPPNSPRLRVWWDYFSGLIAFQEGKNGEALTLFEKALQPMLPNRAPLFPYAVALVKAGRTDQAVQELKRATWWSFISAPMIDLSFLPGRESWPADAVKAHYWLGVAYEQKGDKAKARAEYEKFLDIWKEADFNSPELADAKARLAKLNASAKS